MPPAIPNSGRIVLAALALTVAAFFAAQALPETAGGVTATGKPTVTVTPDSTGSVAVYEFSRYRTARNENVTGCSITFPAGTDVSGAAAVNPAGSIVTTGTTITITFDVPVVPDKTTFTVIVGGLVNPAAGLYNAGNITLYTVNTVTGTTGSVTLATGDYTITASYISMTITTPAAGQTVVFGNIDPGVSTPSQAVTVEIDSSAPYSLSRAPGGDAGLLGLLITGDAVGPKLQGIGTFTDTYSLNPPWTTDPSILLTATVVYTAVQ